MNVFKVNRANYKQGFNNYYSDLYDVYYILKLDCSSQNYLNFKKNNFHLYVEEY